MKNYLRGQRLWLRSFCSSYFASIGYTLTFFIIQFVNFDGMKKYAKENENIHIACFLGHSGWSPGQLEDELKLDSWVVSNLNLDLFEQMNEKAKCWKSAISGISDEMKLLADAPEKPWRN